MALEQAQREKAQKEAEEKERERLLRMGRSRVLLILLVFLVCYPRLFHVTGYCSHLFIRSSIIFNVGRRNLPENRPKQLNLPLQRSHPSRDEWKHIGRTTSDLSDLDGSGGLDVDDDDDSLGDLSDSDIPELCAADEVDIDMGLNMERPHAPLMDKAVDIIGQFGPVSLVEMLRSLLAFSIITAITTATTTPSPCSLVV